jgi:sortase A
MIIEEQPLDPDLESIRRILQTLARPQPQPKCIGNLSLPTLGESHELYAGLSNKCMHHGPILVPESSWPGRGGMSVILGHRTTHSRPFRHIDKLSTGDTAKIKINAEEFVYQVTHHTVCLASEMNAVVKQYGTPDSLVLASCHPPGHTDHRLLVFTLPGH